MILVEEVKERTKAIFFGYSLCLFLTLMLFISGKSNIAVLILAVLLEVVGVVFSVFSIISNPENFDRRLRTLCYTIVLVLFFSFIEIVCISRFEAGSSSGQDTSPISSHSEGSSPSPATNYSFLHDEDH